MYRVYQVQGDDTINKIAQNLNISVQDLVNLNSLIGDVYPGQLLVIPNQNTNFDVYIVEKKDNMYEIASKNNISVEDLLAINGLNKNDYIYPGQQILIPKKGTSIYITKEETLSELSDKLGISQLDIINQNESLYLLPEQLVIYRK